MARHKKSRGGRGYNAQITKIGLGVAVGAGIASLAGKLPIPQSVAPLIGVYAAYTSAGAIGAVAFAIASGALSNISGIISSVTQPAATGQVF